MARILLADDEDGGVVVLGIYLLRVEVETDVEEVWMGTAGVGY